MWKETYHSIYDKWKIDDVSEMILRKDKIKKQKFYSAVKKSSSQHRGVQQFI